MARIPEDELERLKRDLPLADLCAKYGIELKPQGKDLIGHCPFHDDKTPSFVVTPSKNLWNCLGACGCGGDNVQFIMKREGVSFRHAVERLREWAGAVPEASVLKTRMGAEHPVLVEPGSELSDAALLDTVTGFYHQQFCASAQTMGYLQHRKCFHPEAVTKFRLGFANRTLGYRIPSTTVQGKALKAQLTRLGILRDTGHEHLSGCVLVPVIFDGRVTEIYGRRVQKPVGQASEHLYLPGPHGGVWNADEIKLSREWLLCEAAMDALSFWCQGFRNVTWSYGVNGFTPDHWQLLRTARPERVIIAYDNDEAGNRAANELAQRLEPEGVAAWRVELPLRQDINDLVRPSTEPQAALSSLLAGAKRMLPPNSRVFHLAAPLPEPPLPEAAKKETPAPQPVAKPTPPQAESGEPVFSVSEDGREALMQAGERLWRVRGLDANSSFDHLKANIRLGYRSRFHLDTFDLYAARARAVFIAQAEQVTGANKEVLESDLMALVEHLDAHQQKQIVAKMKPVDAGPVMPPEEEAAALRLLKEPKLFERILADYVTAGTVGEDANINPAIKRV